MPERRPHPIGFNGARHLLVFGILIAGLVCLVAGDSAQAGGVAARADGAQARAVPNSFVRHENRYWTWYAPRRWVAASGASAIRISSPTGTKFNDYQVGAVPCVQNVAAFFRSIRAQIKNQGGLYTRPLRSARYTAVGPLRRRGNYYKQGALFRGVRRSGGAVKGQVELDLTKSQFGCSGTGQVRGAPQRGYARSLRTLNAIQNALKYHAR